ncbi:hypothetical protein NHP190012_02500 [Helicobacter sp. NHP19-012]|uniref:Anthranilate synthase component I N-terminal domain-containing protein n=1 Tax=Helicobacter gastrofelis TaxID=2849642 RepID=A0ABN6I4Y7_9HELI|nr:hypothetical protein NHP190012_02500 [Helicobacter sp. NHP19-012]
MWGYFGFEFVGAFEDLPPLKATDNTAPDFIFLVAQNLILIDHQAQSTQIFGACFEPTLKAQIQAEIDSLARLNPPHLPPSKPPKQQLRHKLQ